MQASGVVSFLFCVVCMYCIFRGWEQASYWIFALSMVSFMLSLVLSLLEITLSTRALEIELRDMEELTKSNFFGDILRVREEREEPNQ
jgi:hypothetical protein